jgi:ABC-2 type transport system permease protein
MNFMKELNIPLAKKANLKEELQTGKSSNQWTHNAFWAIVKKEFTDNIKSWKIIILLAIIFLTCIGSLYSVLTSIREYVADEEGIAEFLFLKIFTLSDGTLPSFLTFVTFLGPLLGIALGFDAINSERNKGTLNRIMAQPIPRDYVINAKFTAALLINMILFLTLGLLTIGLGIIILGVSPSFEEFFRVISFLFLSIVYVAFWLNLGILFSVKFRQAATSALAGIAVWLFFSIFYSMIVNLINKAMIPSSGINNIEQAVEHQNLMQVLMRLSPNYLFTESTTTLLTPSIRSLGPLTMEQTIGAIPSPLPLGQSILILWPQITGLLAASLICFAISYILFMRQEIRS